MYRFDGSVHYSVLITIRESLFKIIFNNGLNLLSTYYVPGTVLYVLDLSFHVIFAAF